MRKCNRADHRQPPSAYLLGWIMFRRRDTRSMCTRLGMGGDFTAWSLEESGNRGGGYFLLPHKREVYVKLYAFNAVNAAALPHRTYQRPRARSRMRPCGNCAPARERRPSPRTRALAGRPCSRPEDINPSILEEVVFLCKTLKLRLLLFINLLLFHESI